MCEAKKLLNEYEKNRPKVLSPEVRAYANSLVKDPKRSLAFLKEAGIVGKDGKLTRFYSGG